MIVAIVIEAMEEQERPSQHKLKQALGNGGVSAAHPGGTDVQLS